VKYPDISAIDRILKAMSIGRCRQSLNVQMAVKRALLDDLNFAFAIQRAAVEVGSDKLRRERESRRSKIQQTAWELAELLRADAADSSRVLRYYPLTEADPRRISILLSWAARESKKPAHEPPAATAAADELVDTLTARSPFDCLVGEQIGPIFDDFFPLAGPEYTTSTEDGATDSPKVRFIAAVLSEFDFTNRGQPYAFGSIAAALKNAKHGHSRRKSARKRQLLRT
jgi:hypothetical protein